MSGNGKPTLRLVRGGKDGHRFGRVSLSVFSLHDVPACDAIVVEEDSWQILAAGPEFTLCREHPVRIMTELLDTKPLPAGTVMLREMDPLLMVAVVYDFDSVPCCRPRWVSTALREVFRICRLRKIQSLLLPLPGSRYGRFPARKSLRLVFRILRHDGDCGLRRVSFVCTTEEEKETVDQLLASETEFWSRSRK